MSVSFFAALAAMAIFASSMVCIAVTDLRTRKIWNGLVIALLIAYAGLAPLAGFTFQEIGRSVLAALAVLLVALVLFSRGVIGGGDAKLAAVISMWFGADHTPAYFMYMALVGGAFALGILMFRMLPLPAGMQNGGWVAQLHSKGTGMPYGVAMALAGLIVLPTTHWAATVFGI
jgi:prepilin peptidase CpaA